MTAADAPITTRPLRASNLLRNRRTLMRLAAISGVVVALMTLLYFGSIVDPSAHLHGLPVALVDEDSGATTPTGRIDFGHQVVWPA